MGSTQDSGIRGEQAAVEFLRAEGFLIMDTNWRSGRYELDIVASRGDAIHFIEVKYRKAGGLTTPEEAIDSKKARALMRAANDYISAHCIELDCHIDLIAVDAWSDGSLEIRYIPDAILPRW